MFYILAVILIAIGGILFILFFDDKPKVVPHQKIDSRAIPFDQNTLHTDMVEVVFDEPTDIRHINMTLDPTDNISGEVEEINENTSTENKKTLITNSKINPFNF